MREFYFQSWEIKENESFFRKSGKVRELLSFIIVSFRSSDFLHAQPCIQLSVIVAKFYPSVSHSVLCSHFEGQFRFCD